MCEEYEVVDPITQDGKQVYCPYVRGQCQPNCVMNDSGECLQAKALKTIIHPCMGKNPMVFRGNMEDMPPELRDALSFIAKQQKEDDDADFKE